jgi:hypothetical protein
MTPAPGTSWAGALKAALLITAFYAAFLFLWKYLGAAYVTLLLRASSPFIKAIKGITIDSTSVSGGKVIAAFTDHPLGWFKMGVTVSVFTRDVPPTLAVLAASWPFTRRGFGAGWVFYASALGVLFAVDVISSVLVIARAVTLWEVQHSPPTGGLGAAVWVFLGSMAEDLVKSAAPFAMGFYVYLAVLTKGKAE